MLVSHAKRFIYTKTIKTAGTSVEAYFEPYCFPPGEHRFLHARPQYESATGIVGFRGLKRAGDGNDWYNHAPAVDIRAKVGDEIWSSYFKFCVVRDPFEKLVSAFHHFALPSDRCESLSLPEIREEFRRWVRGVRLQLFDDWNIFTIDDRICMDYLIRYERLLTGIEEVCEQLRIAFEPEKLPRIKSEFNPRRWPSAEYYDHETATLAAEAYIRQVRLFGFPLPA